MSSIEVREFERRLDQLQREADRTDQTSKSIKKKAEQAQQDVTRLREQADRVQKRLLKSA
jgi:hypothetical protein